MSTLKNDKHNGLMTNPGTEHEGHVRHTEQGKLQILVDDAEFRNLLPPKSADEMKKLYQDLDENGLEDLIDVDQYYNIIDGYHRADWARDRYPDGDVPGLKIRVRQFSDRAAVMRWIFNRQFERRNLNAAQRVYIALKLKPHFMEKAKQNQRLGKGSLNSENAAQPVDALRSVAELAGVSRDTAAKVETVLKSEDQEVIAAMLGGELSIHAAASRVKPPVDKQPDQLDALEADDGDNEPETAVPEAAGDADDDQVADETAPPTDEKPSSGTNSDNRPLLQSPKNNDIKELCDKVKKLLASHKRGQLNPLARECKMLASASAKLAELAKNYPCVKARASRRKAEPATASPPNSKPE